MQIQHACTHAHTHTHMRARTHTHTHSHTHSLCLSVSVSLSTTIVRHLGYVRLLPTCVVTPASHGPAEHGHSTSTVGRPGPAAASLDPGPSRMRAFFRLSSGSQRSRKGSMSSQNELRLSSRIKLGYAMSILQAVFMTSRCSRIHAEAAPKLVFRVFPHAGTC